MRKTVIRKRGQERVRLETDRETLVNSLLSQTMGESVTLLRKKAEKETVWSERDFEKTLSKRQFERSIKFFQRSVKKHIRYQTLETMIDQTEFIKKDFVVCQTCKKQQTFKSFYFTRLCLDCNSQRLVIDSYYIVNIYINNYERVSLNFKTNKVNYQRETNSGIWSKGWKNYLSGIIARDL